MALDKNRFRGRQASAVWNDLRGPRRPIQALPRRVAPAAARPKKALPPPPPIYGRQPAPAQAVTDDSMGMPDVGPPLPVQPIPDPAAAVTPLAPSAPTAIKQPAQLPPIQSVPPAVSTPPQVLPPPAPPAPLATTHGITASPANAATTPTSAGRETEPEPTVSININLSGLSGRRLLAAITGPAYQAAALVRRLSHSILRLVAARRRLSYGIAAAVVLLMIGLAGTKLVMRLRSAAAVRHAAVSLQNAASGTGTTANQAGQAVKPSFTPVVPQSKPELATVAAGVSSYDAAKHSYAFTDNYLGRAILVSEQPLPHQFSNATDALATIAKQLKANSVVAVKGSQIAYLATDGKTNAQTLVYAVGSILIFVQSPFSHTAQQWTAYLATLAAPSN